MGQCSIKGLLLEKKIYTHSYEKKLDEVSTDEIHAFAKMYTVKAEYIAPLGLLPGHVLFHKIDIIEI